MFKYILCHWRISPQNFAETSIIDWDADEIFVNVLKYLFPSQAGSEALTLSCQWKGSPSPYNAIGLMMVW